MKVYMPRKPHKFGIKIWSAVDPTNLFLCNAEVYTGKVQGVSQSVDEVIRHKEGSFDPS
jgi:Transposase IS4